MEPAPLHAANERRAASGAAAQVAQARTALRVATDPGHVRVLRARVEQPRSTLAEIAESVGMSKSAYWGRLRRAMATPDTTTRQPVESPPPRPRAGVPSGRSARAIRIGTGRTSNLGVRPLGSSARTPKRSATP